MNTKKVLEAACANCNNVELIPLPSDRYDVSGYDFVGFASGIYYLNFGKPVYEHINQIKGLEGKHCFCIATSGMGWERFGSYPKDAIIKKGGLFEGSISIKALDTIAPFNWFGGLNKNHPNQINLGSRLHQHINIRIHHFINWSNNAQRRNNLPIFIISNIRFKSGFKKHNNKCERKIQRIRINISFDGVNNVYVFEHCVFFL